MIGQSRTRLLGVAVLVAMFAVGGLTGAVVQRSATAADSSENTRPTRGPSLFETLQLTDDQQQQVCSIVQRRAEQIRPYNEAMKAFWEQQEPAVRAVISAANAEMDSVLTSEQRLKKDEFRAERERYFKERQEKMREGGEHRGGERGDRGGRGSGGPGSFGNPLGVKCPGLESGPRGPQSGMLHGSPWS